MPLQRTAGQCHSRDYKTARVPVCCNVLPKGGRQHELQARDVGPDYHLGCPSDASSRHWPSRRSKRSSVCCYSRASSCRRSTLDATSDTSDTQAQQRSCHLTDGTLAIHVGACCSVALLPTRVALQAHGCAPVRRVGLSSVEPLGIGRLCSSLRHMPHMAPGNAAAVVAVRRPVQSCAAKETSGSRGSRMPTLLCPGFNAVGPGSTMECVHVWKSGLQSLRGIGDRRRLRDARWYGCHGDAHLFGKHVLC